jgi:hypothetical protein
MLKCMLATHFLKSRRQVLSVGSKHSRVCQVLTF